MSWSLLSVPSAAWLKLLKTDVNPPPPEKVKARAENDVVSRSTSAAVFVRVRIAKTSPVPRIAFLRLKTARLIRLKTLGMASAGEKKSFADLVRAWKPIVSPRSCGTAAPRVLRSPPPFANSEAPLPRFERALVASEVSLLNCLVFSLRVA
jgi:hypothetical protein